LLHDSGTDFAAYILQQSFGGVDVQRAADELGFRESPSAPHSLAKELDAAKAALREAQSAQHTLSEQARTLDDLERRRDNAHCTFARRTAIERAIQYTHAYNEMQVTKQALDRYPNVLSVLHGNEREQLQNVCTRLDAARQQAERAKANYEQATRAAEDALPGGPLSDDALATLRASVTTLQTLDRAHMDASRTHAAAVTNEREARRVIGAALEDTRLASIDTVKFNELAAFVRQYEQVQAAVTSVDAELMRLGDIVALPDSDVILDGIRILSRWLRSIPAGGDREQGLIRILWVTAVIAILLSVTLAIHWNIVFSVGAALALVLAALGTRRLAPGRAFSRYEQEYRELSLPQPANWSVDNVCQIIDQLLHDQANAASLTQRIDLRNDAERLRASHTERLKQLQGQARALADRFGVAPDYDVHTLGWLSDRISRWQDAARTLAKESAHFEHVQTQYNQQLAQIRTLIASRPEWTAPTTTDEAVGLLDTLEQRHRQYVSAIQRQQHAASDLRTTTAVIEHATEEYEALFTLGAIPIGDVRAFEALCEQYDGYKTAAKHYELAVSLCDAKRGELETDATYDPALPQMSLPELQILLENTRDCETTIATLDTTVTRIRTEVELAERASDVEFALARVANAEAALRDTYVANVHAVIGDRIARYVHHTTRDRHLPDVFHRAREIFAQITDGRYRLDFDSRDDAPTFRAFDVHRGVGQSLETLSSGTQVQLQLAVRVAFVESQEDDTHIPLILDEALGTSDDHRSRAIIDAVIALSKRGRQIFYFTAQSDEAGKWVAALEQAAVPHCIIDLAQRLMTAADLAPLPDQNNRSTASPVFRELLA
jgi:DNA repair exonuclease SbcCD ATPase subunit